MVSIKVLEDSPPDHLISDRRNKWTELRNSMEVLLDLSFDEHGYTEFRFFGLPDGTDRRQLEAAKATMYMYSRGTFSATTNGWRIQLIIDTAKSGIYARRVLLDDLL